MANTQSVSGSTGSRCWSKIAMGAGVGILVTGVACAIIWGLHAHGVSLPKSLASAVGTLSAHPHNWSLWMLTVGSMTTGAILTTYGYYKKGLNYAKKDTRNQHVDVLNSLSYNIDGVDVRLNQPTPPTQITRLTGHSIEDDLAALVLPGNAPPIQNLSSKIEVFDMTTERAIEDASMGGYSVIALNFANEKTVGGNPGFYKSTGGIFISAGQSAQAQEESLSRRSTLFASLTLVPDVGVRDRQNTNVRSNFYPGTGFDSTITAYISEDQLFGVQQGNDFFTTKLLRRPCNVFFVSSAAYCYRRDHTREELSADKMSKEGSAYTDAQSRILTHLYAAATKACALKQTDGSPRVALILGAFGCGAFAPKNGKAYASMIASIYREELPKFNRFFDKITFAIPKMGHTNPAHDLVRNFDVFYDELRKINP